MMSASCVLVFVTTAGGPYHAAAHQLGSRHSCRPAPESEILTWRPYRRLIALYPVKYQLVMLARQV